MAEENPERPVACITGASSGLGKAFVDQLASEGYDLVLVARRAERLEAIREELTAKFPITVEPLVADLTRGEDLHRLEERLRTYPKLELLVNNAGFGTGGYFPNVDLEDQLRMIDLHVLAPVRLTTIALRNMANRHSGQVINVASAGGFFTGPGCATYCATKGYLISFSQSVQADLAGSGLRVQALCPGFILTEFHDTEGMKEFERSRIPKYLWLPPEVVVRESLVQLRRKKHRVICIPTLRYRFLTALMRNSLAQWFTKTFFGDRIRR